MTSRSALYEMVNDIVNMDISFILDDIIGPFAEPDFPINIDFNNFMVEIDTPHGIMHLSLISSNDGSHRELTLKRIVSDTYCEEYKIHLGRYDEDFLCLNGKTIDLRTKGFVINFIEKKYSSSNLTGDSEENRKVYENGNIVVDSIDSVTKIQEVYNNKELKKVYGKQIDNDPTHEKIFDSLGSIKTDIGLKNIYPSYITTLNMSLPVESRISSKFAKCINVQINGYDCSSTYFLRASNQRNLVGRAFNIYQGIINKENYDDAIGLINNFDFCKAFAHEDYKQSQDAPIGMRSINEFIESIAGYSTANPRREYTAEVRAIVESYYNSVKNNPFLFDERSASPNDKKRQLEKNEYIKQILLSNRE